MIPAPRMASASPERPRRRLAWVGAGALVLALLVAWGLRRFEYQLPQWLAEHPPKAELVLDVDHTHGCIAVRNVPMEVIWRAVDDGTPIEIRP